MNKKVIALVAILILITNLVLFPILHYSPWMFWAVILVIGGGAYFLVRSKNL